MTSMSINQAVLGLLLETRRSSASTWWTTDMPLPTDTKSHFGSMLFSRFHQGELLSLLLLSTLLYDVKCGLDQLIDLVLLPSACRYFLGLLISVMYP